MYILNAIHHVRMPSNFAIFRVLGGVDQLRTANRVHLQSRDPCGLNFPAPESIIIKSMGFKTVRVIGIKYNMPDNDTFTCTENDES
jgi:hypothetical protein